ncbi:MAG: RdgB/HAM1 family non-canonical purine NTP pyrophosphatase [Actinobacteria bacterium]|nr:RdgB/HAM1 family non-canonical purine NTP pyrophosphatase [Actinomycetota bacterium]
MKLVLATHNAHKVKEVAAILEPLVPGLELLGYDGPEPVEDGSSFLENSLIKARAAFLHTGITSIADDSGLAIEIMGGSPGIFSARWSGDKDDEKNRNLVLNQLRDVPAGNRAASFVCTISLVGESEEVSFTGVLPGHIAASASGTNGFGYDPIFIPEGFEVSSAELDPEVKNSISHRSMALSQLASYLRPQ